MKPFDWLLAVVHLLFLWLFVGGLLFTEAIHFQLRPQQVKKYLFRRLAISILALGVLLWRLYG